MKLKKKSINRNIVLNVLGTAILQGINFFSAPIFSRALGTANYGVVSVYITWVNLAATVLSLQVGSSIAMARNEFSANEQLPYRSSVLAMALCNYGVAFVILLLLLDPLSGLLRLHKWLLIFAFFHSFGLFCVSFLNVIFTYDFKADKNLILSIVISVSTIALSIFLIQFFPANINYWGRIIALTIIYSISSLIICVHFFSTGKTFFNARYWKLCFPLSFPIIFHSLSGLLLSQSDRLMLRQISGDSCAGVYSLATTFTAVLSTIWNAFNNSWVPFFHQYSREKNYQEIRKCTKNYLELFTVLSIGFMLLAPEVYHVFAAEEYWEGTDIISISAIGIYMVFLYSFPVNYEFYKKKTNIIAIGTVLAAVINIILNFYFIQQMGLFGAALATTIAHTLQFIFHHICAQYLIGEGDYQFELKEAVFSLFLVISVLLINRFVFLSWQIRWMCGFVLGCWELCQIKKRKTIF